MNASATDPGGKVVASAAAAHAGGMVQIMDLNRSSIDLDDLAELVGRSWGFDYRDRSIMSFDRHYLDWLLAGDDVIGVTVFDSRGKLIGFEVGVPRDVRINQQTFRAFYVTLLTVDPDYRGRGIAQKILRRITDMALRELGADLIVSSFDSDAAGQPTVKKSISRHNEMSLQTSKPLRIWACTDDLRRVDEYEPLKGICRAALWSPIRRRLQFSGSQAQVTLNQPNWQSLNNHREKFGVEFELNQNVAQMYDSATSADAGAAEVSIAQQNCGFAAWHNYRLCNRQLPDLPVCQIQLLKLSGCKRDQARALTGLNRILLSKNAAITTLQNGMVSPSVLWRSGFLPTPRTVQFAVRGKAELVQNFGNTSGSFFADLL